MGWNDRSSKHVCAILCQACCPVPNYPGNTGSCLRHLQALQNLQREQLAEQKLLWMCQAEFRDLTSAEWTCCEVFWGVRVWHWPKLPYCIWYMWFDGVLAKLRQSGLVQVWMWCDPHMWQSIRLLEALVAYQKLHAVIKLMSVGKHLQLEFRFLWVKRITPNLSKSRLL